ncbi:mechanosensitive ion channel [Nocardioidaceae bacterium]|nr:mechanosensitive ion channel [Nocardioidaceae bacterium]
MLTTLFLGQELFRFGQTVITTGSVAAALVALLVTGVLILAMRRSIRRYRRGRGQQYRSTLYTVQRIGTYTLLALGFFVAISLLGVPISRLAVVAGALGIGLGFGLQTIFSNFISGLILLFDKSLKVGDFVELESGVTGEVRDIKIRSTTIVTNDNIDILVPNSEFVEGRVVNWTYREVSRRMRIPFGVAYGTDKEVVKEAALKAAGEVPFTLALEGARRPQVWLSEFGDSSLNFELVVWLNAEATKRPAAVKAAYNWALHTALAERELEIPFPQRDLNVRSFFGLAEDDALEALNLERPEETGTGTTGPPASAASEDPPANDAIEDVRSEAGDLPAFESE